MNDFMIHVERIVRPIRALDDHKDRMREELLAHLQASYEEERARQPEEALARAKAIASLGDPARLRSELQDSVSRMERGKARFERLFSWHAPEPAWRYTLRVGAVTVAGFFLLALPTYLALLVSKEGVAEEAVRVMVAMGFLTGLNAFVLGFLYFKTRDSLLGVFGGSRSWLRAALYVFASAATIEGSLLFFLWSFTGNLGDDSVSLLLGRSLIAFALPLVGALVAWFRGPFELRHAEWELLEI